MVSIIYYNVTTAPGIAWYATSSTITNGTVFTVEGQSSTNQLVIRNLWIPFGSSSDIYMSASTGANSTVLVASNITQAYNSFYFLVAASSLTFSIKNNSNTTTVYACDGIVLRV